MFAQPKGTGSALRVVSKVPEEALSYTNLVNYHIIVGLC